MDIKINLSGAVGLETVTTSLGQSVNGHNVFVFLF